LFVPFLLINLDSKNKTDFETELWIPERFNNHDIIGCFLKINCRELNLSNLSNYSPVDYSFFQDGLLSNLQRMRKMTANGTGNKNDTVKTVYKNKLPGAYAQVGLSKKKLHTGQKTTPHGALRVLQKPHPS
jgi:hypothetical protein